MFIDSLAPVLPGRSRAERMHIHMSRLREEGLGYVTETAGRRLESELRSGTAQVYYHEIPGGQLSNLRQQAIALGMADDFERIDHVPVLFASQDVGHYPATFLEPHGGAYGQAAVAWLNWHLKGDQAAARAFIGADCGLCGDPAWSVRSKKLQ